MKTIDAVSALSPGRVTWIVPDLERSRWAQRIDWYLNYQIARAEPHVPASFAPELQDVIEKWEFEAPTVRLNGAAPLMIASSGLIPNHQTIVLPVRSGEAEWILASHRVWVGLGRPPTRIYLPSGVSTAVFEGRWPKGDAEADLEIVDDQA